MERFHGKRCGMLPFNESFKLYASLLRDTSMVLFIISFCMVLALFHWLVSVWCLFCI